jgi:hypothetical protein
MSPSPAAQPWFAVRCIFRFEPVDEPTPVYEERITLWRAASFDDAIERAELEAEDYIADLDGEYLGVSQAYHLFAGEQLGDGTEVFSLMRRSALPAEEYVDRYFAADE